MRWSDDKTGSARRCLLICGGLLLLGLVAGLGWGCRPRLTARTPFSPPPAEYQRQLLLVFEDHNFRPLAGVPVAVEFMTGQPLTSPANRAAGDGSLRLVIKPLMTLGAGSEKNGDLFLNYQTDLKITLWPGETRAVSFTWTDQQTYAYYQDPLYAGQNRRPWEGEEIINFTLERLAFRL